MILARQRIAEVMSKTRLNTAATHQVPSAADNDIKIGDKILVYLEERNRWAGPHKVIDVKKNIVKVAFHDQLTQFSLDRCKPYQIEKKIRDMKTDQDNLADLEL